MHYPGRTFEEFIKDQEHVSPAFIISKREMDEFGRLTGDLNPLHTDPEFCAAQSLFKQPIVQGMATLSFAMGILDKAGIFRGTCLAFAGVDELRFRKPVYPGHALWAKAIVREKKDYPDQPYGQVAFHLAVEDPTGEVMSATLRILVARRAAVLKMGAGPDADGDRPRGGIHIDS